MNLEVVIGKVKNASESLNGNVLAHSELFLQFVIKNSWKVLKCLFVRLDRVPVL